MKQIPLTQGKFALIDDEDFEFLNQWKWQFSKRYATRSKKRKNSRKSDALYMHRIIMKVQNIETAEHQEGEVDHINGNGLDNRKENLRVCTHQQNRANTKIQTNNTSGYKGVTLDREARKRVKRWKVEMKVNSKKIHIGRFLTKEDAAKAYNQAAIKYYGEYARINII